MRWILAIAVVVVWGAGLHLTAAVIGIGGWAVLSYREFQTKRLSQEFRTKRLSQEATEADDSRSQLDEGPEEPEEFTLNLTDENLDKQSGWDYWDVVPKQRRLVHESCFGGPPSHKEVYEYEVRGTAVFVRLVESSREGFEGPRYEVFSGNVVRAEIEAKCPTSKQLSEKYGWTLTELEDPETCFLLSKHLPLSFLVDEHDRLKKAYQAVETEALKLGAVREGDSTWFYSAPENADADTKQAILRLQSDENLLRFGLRYADLSMQKQILSIFETAGA
jgi:hypothetical protein